MKLVLSLIVDKQTYLRFRAAWREDYARLSKQIRLLKHQIAETFKKGQSAAHHQADLLHLRKEAREALEMRKQSKLLVQSQYLAEKQNSLVGK
jgi:hypothetical protein